MWKYFEQRYIQPSGALHFSLLQNLHNTQQQQDMSIEEAFTRITGQLCSMVPKSSVGCKSCVAKEEYEHRTLVFQFVMGLKQNFENIRLVQTRLHSLATTSTPSLHSVLAFPQRPSASRAAPSGAFCSHCKRTGHRPDNCFQLHPELLDEYRARRDLQRRAATKSQSRSLRPSTAAVTEPPAMSASVSALTQSASTSAHPWVLDSGASFHVTSDRSQLLSCQPAQDGASVQTADGSSEQEDHWNWPLP
uniref:Retrotransposon gag domain-containing protein n=1 Tax=Triticum urartu TaxID=4572 RepID=A0A8R7R8I2_TRIUA